MPGFSALNSAHIVKGNLNVNEAIILGAEKFAQEAWPDFRPRKRIYLDDFASPQFFATFLRQTRSIEFNGVSIDHSGTRW